jgi:aromatic ring-opening dioxygenase LigB subunit
VISLELVIAELKTIKEELLFHDLYNLVEEAKVCGFAGMCMIQGCLEMYYQTKLAMVTTTSTTDNDTDPPHSHNMLESQSHGQVFAYAAPTYYGMMVAGMCFTS